MIERIENDFWRLSILPGLGASPVGLEHRIHTHWANVMRPAPEEALTGQSSSPLSSYTLAPYSNRIRDGRFRFQDREYPLRPNGSKGETIHGDVRNRPWRVTRRGDSRLECSFDSRDLTDANFPFAYRVGVIYSLNGADFSTEISLENTDDRAMPAGFGFHPYFVRHLDGQPGDPSLQFRATGQYVTDEKTIPSAGAEPIPATLDFSSPRDAYAVPLDTVYSDWDGEARLSWATHRLVMTASSIFSHFVAFNGAPDGTIALEPISHATDGFNLMARGVPGTGVRILEPGETMSGTVTLRLEANL